MAEAEAEAEKELNVSGGRDALGKRRRDDEHETPFNKRRKIITRSASRQEPPVADVAEIQEEDITDVRACVSL